VPEADARPEGFGRVGEADGRAERAGLLAAGLLVAGLLGVGLLGVGLLVAGLLAGRVIEAVAVGRGVCPAGDVAGLNVATDSIAPATRHTARMLASSGMTVPRPAKGPASRRSRLRRRFARSSRW
jgi:hypothetical protein